MVISAPTGSGKTGDQHAACAFHPCWRSCTASPTLCNPLGFQASDFRPFTGVLELAILQMLRRYVGFSMSSVGVLYMHLVSTARLQSTVCTWIRTNAWKCWSSAIDVILTAAISSTACRSVDAQGRFRYQPGTIKALYIAPSKSLVQVHVHHLGRYAAWHALACVGRLQCWQLFSITTYNQLLMSELIAT